MGLICLIYHLAGKTSPFCYLGSHCPFAIMRKMKYEANLTSYESACQKDPELESFDSSLRGRTSKFMSSLPPRQGKNENPSLGSLIQVCGFLKDLGQDLVKIIIGYNEDVRKNEELKSLVDLYFEGTSKTLDFFSTVEDCVKEAQHRLLDLRLAIKKYETESEFGGSMPDKYAETLEQLNKVTNMGDPFGDDFSKQYESVRQEHVMILEKIGELQVKLDKKHKNVKKLRIVVNAIFATALLSLIALTVVSWSVATPAPSVVTGVKVLSASIGPAGNWVNRMMSSDEALKQQIETLTSTEIHTTVNIESMKTIKGLVRTLQSQIKSIFQTVEVAVQNRKEEEAMKFVMQKIIKEVNDFADQIDSFGKHVADCSKYVAEGKVSVLKHMAS